MVSPLATSLHRLRRCRRARCLSWAVCTLLVFVALTSDAFAHGVSARDMNIMSRGGIVVFAYLGAKHMVTGYDHLLFLFGVIFFLYRLRDVGTYVTLFAVGHSVTLLLGVLSGLHVNAFLIDAVIGLSVVYKALDNMGAFQRILGFQPNTKLMVLVFGFFHGFGLATKLQDVIIVRTGLVTSILAFNVGVEIGQLLALSAILIAMGFWRHRSTFVRHAFAANVILMACGFVLVGYQLAGFVAGS